MENYLVLKNEEKKEIIKSALKNIQFQKYNAELSILQETELGNQQQVESLNTDLQNLLIKESVLVNELDKLG